MKKNQKINKELKKSKIIEIKVKREKGNKSQKKKGNKSPKKKGKSRWDVKKAIPKITM